MAKSVGIDAGDYAVAVVELDGSYRKTRLVRCRIEEVTGDGVEAERALDAAHAAARAIREAKMSGDEVLGHPCYDAVLRKLTVPFSGRDAIRKIIKSEAENFIHSHPIDDMIVDFHQLGEAEDGARVLLAAVPKTGLRTMLTSLQHESIEPERVDLDTMALFRVAHWYGALDPDAAVPSLADVDEAAGDEPAGELPSLDGARLTAVLDLGARSTRVLLVAAGKLVDMRTIRLGDATVVENLARQHGIGFEQARDAIAAVLATGGDFDSAPDDLIGDDVLALDDDYEDEDEDQDGDVLAPATVDPATVDPATVDPATVDPATVAEAEADDEIGPYSVTVGQVHEAQTAYLQRLARELVRFLTAAGASGSFATVWVCGSACRTAGMPEMLTEVFGVAPDEIDVLSRLRHSLPEEEAAAVSPRIATAVGLALANYGGPTGFQLRQEDLAYTRGFDRVKFPLAIACMVAVFTAVVYFVKLNNQLRTLEFRIGATYEGELANPDRPQFYGQLNGVLSSQWFDDRRYFEYTENGKVYGWRELQEDLVGLPVDERIKFVRMKLRKVLEEKQRESGIYEEVSLESGLAVLVKFFEVLKGAEASVGKYLLCSLDLDMEARNSGPESGRFLDFRVAIRGSDFRARISALRAAFEAECEKPGSPFNQISEQRNGEQLFTDGDEKGVYGAYITFRLSIPGSFEPFPLGTAQQPQ